MKKLIQGIVEFRRNVQPSYRQALGRLALDHSPDTLMIACSDSRVVPNTFASTNPGDLFVLRNVGNLIPACEGEDCTHGDDSEAAVIELAVDRLQVRDIVVCGHSECAAMRFLVTGRDQVNSPRLRSWLRHGESALKRWRAGSPGNHALSDVNGLSQANVLAQMDHLRSYPSVQRRLAEGTLRIHGWWFDLAQADVYHYDPETGVFVVIDEAHAQKMLTQLEGDVSGR